MRKTILVTGGAGLVGTRLCGRLVAEGHTVISLDNYFAGSRDNHLPGIDYREGHTKDIEQHISERPDLIFHLGEYARVEQSILEPEVVHDLNIEGTTGVIEFWKKHKCKLVYAGSSTKFGNSDWDKEAVPYVATKAANTVRIREIGECEGLPYAITYFYNVYGPGERAGIYGTVIETFKQMYLTGEPFAVTSPGTQRRNFTHVDDIVEGLVLVAEKGQGDEFGLGCDTSFSILEVAQLFGGEVLMLPPRMGNRMCSELDASKAKALGWSAKRNLPEYIRAFTESSKRAREQEKRVLVFSTTFYPTVGPAEEALIDLMRAMPDLTFDVVTTAFSKGARSTSSPVPNAEIHHVGIGRPIDKYLLPLLGTYRAWRLHRTRRYLFTWAIMASYAALTAVLSKRLQAAPLLITLADQRLSGLPRLTRFFLRAVLTGADQVHGASAVQEQEATRASGGTLPRSTLGEGDAFANQIRYAYAQNVASSSRSS